MLIKKIKFVDYKGNEQEKEYAFNLSRAEVLRLEVSHKGGLSEKLQRIVKAEDRKELLELFEDLILTSVGEVSDDGLNFLKSKERSLRFEQSEAYSELLMELVQDAELAANFVNGIVPKIETIETKPKK